jgi:hypothetical protein
MKPAITYPIIFLMMATILSSCGKSDEQIKKVGALQLESFQLQQQLYSKMSELSKLAWQIEALANRRDQIALGMANDVHTAQGLIAEVFKTSGDEGMQPALRNDVDEMTKKLGTNIDMLKNAIDKASIAIIKSRDVIVAYKKNEAQKYK